MDKYIKMVDWALKSDRATAVLTAATYPNSTYTPYQYVIMARYFTVDSCPFLSEEMTSCECITGHTLLHQVHYHFLTTSSA